MNDCGACEPFVAETEQLFAATLDRYHFERVACGAQGVGSDCQATYESSVGRLLFFISDGCANVCLGSRRAPFHAAATGLGDGDGGWYHLVTLAEVATGEPLLTPQLQRRLLEGRLSYYHWQAALLAERAGELFPLLDPANERALAEVVSTHTSPRARGAA